MWITFKTLEQKTFKIEIEDTVKVRALKEKIAEERGGDQFPVAGQKLIYSGKILDDEKLLSECNIDPVKNFVVVMVVKPKAKVAETASITTPQSSHSAEATPAAPTTTTTTETAEAPSTASASVTTAEETTTTPTAESITTASSTPAVEVPQNTTEMAESALLTGSALESSITELMSLGYSREEVMRALNRSFHNADRAAEYLLSGTIPDLPNEPEDGDAPAIQNIAPSATSENLNFLRNLPQFQMMRRQVQAHPDTLPQLLQEIGRSNPELLSVISQNQEDFIALLNEPRAAETATGGQAGSGAEGGAEGGPLQIQVTPSEKESIDRMVSMGFAEGEVIQAFFACDKNEQLAIEFLLKD